MADFDISVDPSGVAKSLSDLRDRWESDAVYKVGTNVEYAVFLEFGTEKMPPYPFFRPAIREFQANPEDFITDNTGFSDVDQIPDGDTLVKVIAQALVSKMENNVSAASSTDRSPGVDPDHPMRDTGNLVNDISAVRVN